MSIKIECPKCRITLAGIEGEYPDKCPACKYDFNSAKEELIVLGRRLEKK